MRRIIIAVPVCLFLSIFSFQSIKAAEEIKECVGEPTDQIIQYGNFLDGSDCRISPLEIETYFVSKVAEMKKLLFKCQIKAAVIIKVHALRCLAPMGCLRKMVGERVPA